MILLEKLSPTSAWIALLLAGALEVLWALGLKYSDGLTRFCGQRSEPQSPSC